MEMERKIICIQKNILRAIPMNLENLFLSHEDE